MVRCLAEFLKANKQVLLGGFEVTRVLNRGVDCSLGLVKFGSSPPWCGKQIRIRRLTPGSLPLNLLLIANFATQTIVAGPAPRETLMRAKTMW